MRKIRLDLSGLTVLTEAATGAFSATAPMAALARAQVFAVARNNAHASAQDCRRETARIARSLGVRSRISFVSHPSEAPLEKIDIVTNSGNVRPLEKSWLKRLPSTAVVSLMVEPWEVRPCDVDLEFLHRRGIVAAGVNEHGPKNNLFRYLFPLLRTLLRTDHLPLRGQAVFLLCGPQFRPHLAPPIRSAGARLTFSPDRADLVIVATGPNRPVSSAQLTRVRSGVPTIQLWGDVVPRRPHHLKWYPEQTPQRGHMGYRLDDLGPEPALRLAAAGLKVGELLSRLRREGHPPVSCLRYAVVSGFAMSCGR